MEDAETPAASPGTKSVLIIEDDEGMGDLLEMIAVREGFRCGRVANGAEVLQKAGAFAPDLILLDLMLPGKSGYELLGELQANGLGQVPVVVLTAKSMDRKGVDLLRQEPNVREFLKKPPQPAALAVLLHRLLGTRPKASA